MTKIKPLHNYIVIEKIDDKDISSGGIHLIRAPKNQPCIAKVLAVGPGVLDEEVRKTSTQGVRVSKYNLNGNHFTVF